MKSIFLLLLLIPFAAFSQGDTINIKHALYETTFSREAKYPVKVHYVLTAEMVNCAKANKIKRKNKFTADPMLPAYTQLGRDYKKSGYDQGHNMAEADNACSPATDDECWYYSNITPQTPQLNRFPWRLLEEHCRKLAKAEGSIDITCGAYGHAGEIGKHKVWVPAYCWKTIRHRDGRIEYYLMPNTTTANVKKFTAYKVDTLTLPTGGVLPGSLETKNHPTKRRLSYFDQYPYHYWIYNPQSDDYKPDQKLIKRQDKSTMLSTQPSMVPSNF